MTDDLVTRRDEMQARFDALGGWDGISDMLQKAMDRIKADAATIARLTAERDSASGLALTLQAECERLHGGMSTPIKNVDFETRLEQHGRLFAAIDAVKGAK